MNYVIDQGNTTIKLGTFLDNKLVHERSWADEEEFLKHFEALDAGNVLVSSVTGNAKRLAAILGHGNHKLLLLDQMTALPISNHYGSPGSLGMDRIAAACGAKLHFPSDDCLVVDFGTCITYDFIDREGRFEGGAITPGMNMRLKAMHAFTSSLPLIEQLDESPLVGKTTAESMKSGVLNGIMGELEYFIAQHREQHDDLKILFCGGDYARFESRLKEPIFAAPNLVLTGLNSILRHNNEELE